MTIADKSLVGFMEKKAAIKYLRNVCDFGKDASDAKLEHEWVVAKSKIGLPIATAGNPQINDIPPEHQAHIDNLVSQEWLKPKLSDSLKGATFKCIEIAPLLAMQFTVCTQRATDLCDCLSKPPAMKELLGLCLPIAQPQAPMNLVSHGKSMHITTKNLSVRIAKDGVLEPETKAGKLLHIGVHLDLPVPLLHVVRFNGKCYLHNGFHRAFGAQLAGATHVPCIFRDVQHSADIGIGPDTFGLDLLQSANPPTVGHFTQTRAHDVKLKSLTRVIHVSWAEYTVDGF